MNSKKVFELIFVTYLVFSLTLLEGVQLAKFNSHLNKKSLNTNSSANLIEKSRTKGISLNIDHLKKVTESVLKGMEIINPPEFCWKKGLDFGLIPTDCPSNMFRSLALCYEYCPSNYNFVLGVCWEKCPKDSTDLGAICSGGSAGGMKIKKSYISRSITNFSDEVPCPGDMYKGGALCYRNCETINMFNCGIGACVTDKKSCMGTILKMAFDVIQGLMDGITFIVSFGGSAAIPMVKNSLKKLGKGVIKASIRATQKAIFRVGKRAAVMKVVNFAKDYLKDFTKDAAMQIAQDMLVERVAESLITKSLAINTDLYNEEYFINKIDVIGIGSSVKDCQNAADSSSNTAACVGSILGVLSTFDPTGLTSIAAAFAKPICDVPVSISAEQKKIRDEIEANEREERMRVPERCIRVFSECNYKGTHSTFCAVNYSDKNLILKKDWLDKIRSIVIGDNINIGASLMTHAEAMKIKNYQIYMATAKQNIPCVETTWSSWALKIKHIYFDLQDCFYLFSEKDFQGEPEMFCGNRNATYMNKRAKSFKKWGKNNSKTWFYAGADFTGDKILVTEMEIADLSKIGWENRIVSVSNVPSYNENCLLICSKCNFEGDCIIVCENTDFTSLKNFDNKVASLIVGNEIKNGIISDWLYHDSELRFLKPGEEIQCLSGTSLENKVSLYYKNGEKCVLLYTEPNYGGSSQLHCKGNNLSYMHRGRVQSLKKVFDVPDNMMTITLYDDYNQIGNSLDVFTDNPDLGDWKNKVLSVGLSDKDGEY